MTLERRAGISTVKCPIFDVDYIQSVRNYLKDEWAPKTFGADRVCSIGNYATFGIKMAFQDMARVHGESRTEILDITTKLGLKDEEGKTLTFDKALELYPILKQYCDDHPDIAKAVKKLLHRNRGMGKHAGGLIIANGPINKFIPLVKNAKDDTISSAWTEGLHSQDLGPVGLIKFDLLVVSDLERCAIAADYVRKRHNLNNICALPGLDDWSDLSYKNDPKALRMADKGDLIGVFQFDSAGIRSLVKRGGVTSFDDLVAYNSLFRPGPMGCIKIGTLIKTIDGLVPIEQLKTWQDYICYLDPQGEIKSTKKYFVTNSGKKKMLKITTKSGKIIFVSHDHRFLTQDHGYLPAENIRKFQKIAVEK